MKISDHNSSINVNNFVQDLQDKPTGKAKDQKQAQISSDDVKVELSSQSKEMLKAKSQMDAIPDVRTEKVEKIKTDIVNGTYKIDGSQVAFNMIKESILDELA